MKFLIKFLLITFSIFLGYYIINQFQIYLLNIFNTQSSENLLASYIYLPHGFRVIVSYIFGTYSLIGLFIAHLITGIESLSQINSFIIIVSFFSTIAPISAIFLVFRKIRLTIEDIKIKNILLVSFLSSILNSFFSVLTRFVFNFYEDKKIFSLEFFKFFVGDVFGVLFLFLLLILLLNLKNFFLKI